MGKKLILPSEEMPSVSVEDGGGGEGGRSGGGGIMKGSGGGSTDSVGKWSILYSVFEYNISKVFLYWSILVTVITKQSICIYILVGRLGQAIRVRIIIW